MCISVKVYACRVADLIVPGKNALVAGGGCGHDMMKPADAEGNSVYHWDFDLDGSRG